MDLMTLLDSFSIPEVSNRGAGYSMQNKFVTKTVAGVTKTHIVYQKSNNLPYVADESFTTYVNTYNHNTGEVSQETLIGTDYDDHGTPSITVDPDGYLHIVHGPHHTDIKYRKSTNPNDSTSWGTELLIPEPVGHVGALSWTYPIIQSDSLGALHIMASLYTATGYVKINPAGAIVENKVIYNKGTDFSRYNCNMVVAPNDDIHIFAPEMEWTTDPATDITVTLNNYHHYISTDGGATFIEQVLAWEITDGVCLSSNVTVDNSGRPHLTLTTRHAGNPKKLYHRFHNGSSWVTNIVHDVVGEYVWNGMVSRWDGDELILSAEYVSTTPNASDAVASPKKVIIYKATPSGNDYFYTDMGLALDDIEIHTTNIKNKQLFEDASSEFWSMAMHYSTTDLGLEDTEHHTLLVKRHNIVSNHMATAISGTSTTVYSAYNRKIFSQDGINYFRGVKDGDAVSVGAIGLTAY